MARIAVHREIDEALRSGHPVVALETAVTTHGLPRQPLRAYPSISQSKWDQTTPANLATTRAMQRIVREGGAVPATIGIVDRTLHIGLDDESLTRLALDESAEKASTANLAQVLASGAAAGTTVSATLAACSMPEAGPIRVMATGGIGGVHRNWTRTPDISADLRELAATPACVVCTGAKSILDLPATVEALETLGVPIVGYRTDFFPRFHALGDERLTVQQRVDEPAAAAELCRTQWRMLRRPGGILLVNPIPAEHALDANELDTAVFEANRVAEERGIAAAARTPFLLDELARLTEDRSIIANIALLLHNAQLAAEVAAAMTQDS